MKRLVRVTFLVFVLAVLALLGSAVSFAGTGSIQVKLDGKDIVSDSPPVIEGGRTLIPARALFEAMGGTVNWDASSRAVEVSIRDITVNLIIDSRKAYINGAETTLDVPARIIKNRTMIPIRFVSEAAGCQVSWDEKNRIVSVVTPDRDGESALAVISGIEISRKGDQVIIEGDKELDVTSFKMSNPSRFVMDINHARLDRKDGTVDTGDSLYFKSIRYSQYTKDSVRIVADLINFSTGAVSRSDSMRTAYMTFEANTPEVPGEIIEPDGITSKEDQEILDRYGLQPVAAEAQHKLVVIDPGHGGSDTGSRGFENGTAVLNEKDLNLDIALRIREMLKAAGVRLYMIRTGDVTIPLYDRQDTANLLEASLYVAVHNNSYTNSTPSGTEVHYHGKGDPVLDGISAMALAENLQNTFAENLGLPNRGTKVSPELAVLRRTVMPAVIIEGAFLSNPNDLNYMKTDDFREKYAMSAAKCIIDALNNSVE